MRENERVKKAVQKESRCVTDENETLKDNNWRQSSSSRVTSQANIKTLSRCVAQIQRQSCETQSIF